MEAANEVRLNVWRQQPAGFFDEAVLDADGTLAPTSGECKEGMDIAYDGTWGYHPLLISLANTAEPLYLVNRSGNRPSHEGAAPRFDQAIGWCQRAGFHRILLRGDTDFSQTRHLDGWDGQGVDFIFGIDARANLVARADALEPDCWAVLEREARIRGGHPAPPASRQGQGTDRSGTRFQEHSVAGRRRGRVRLPARRL